MACRRLNVPRSDLVPIENSNVPVFRTTNTPKDGNCMFHAFARALKRYSEDYADVRKMAVRYMGTHSELFSLYVLWDDGETQEFAFRRYLSQMVKPGTYGDDLALRALCLAYRVRISVLQKLRDGRLLWTHFDEVQEASMNIWLYLESEHYEILQSTDLYKSPLLV